MRVGPVITLLGAIAILVCARLDAQRNPFLGAWNITGDPPREHFVYWLEVNDAGGKPAAVFLNRGGSPVPVENLQLSHDELSFTVPVRSGQPPRVSLRSTGAKLTGVVVTGDMKVAVTGLRPPTWGPCNANAAHRFGKPVALFDGRTLDAWDLQHKDRPSGWSVQDGVMGNVPKANNLVSKQRFDDFRIDAEYKLSPKGNSGLYLRGRYELQILDDAGTRPESHGHMSIYARRSPDVNASKPAGEWQTAQITLVGNCVTAVLNDKTVQNNVRIYGITGGALDAKETEPGPFMIQGDHEQVWFRKVVVTPILKTR